MIPRFQIPDSMFYSLPIVILYVQNELHLKVLLQKTLVAKTAGTQ